MRDEQVPVPVPLDAVDDAAGDPRDSTHIFGFEIERPDRAVAVVRHHQLSPVHMETVRLADLHPRQPLLDRGSIHPEDEAAA